MRMSDWSSDVCASDLALAAWLMLWGGALPLVSWVAIALWGLAFGILPVSLQTHVARAASDEAESVGAMLLTAFKVAISSGAVLGGLMVDTQGPLGVVTFSRLPCALGVLALLARGGRPAHLHGNCLPVVDDPVAESPAATPRH